MRIVKAGDINDNERSSLFHRENYSRYESARGWQTIYIADEGGALIPLKLKKARFITQAQYLYPPVKQGKRLSPAEEKSFLEKLNAFCKEANVCDFISPPLHFSTFHSVPAKSYFTELGVMMLNLDKNEEDLFKAFKSNYRNEIRKAIAENVEVEFGGHLFEIFYDLYRSTHKRQQAYFDPREDMLQLVETIGSDNCQIAVVRRGDEIYGAALILYYGSEAYYYQAGSADKVPYPGANKLLQFEIIKWLKKEGVKRYCLGGYRLGNVAGTKYDGIQKFKMHFGATLDEGYHFYSIITWRYPIYKFIFGLYLMLRGATQNTSGLNWRHN